MKIGILGTGDVGQALGTGFITIGDDVKMGGREAGNPKAVAWAQKAGTRASAGTFAEAAAFGDVVVLATVGVAGEAALKAAGLDHIRGKVLIDATNPLDFSQGRPALAINGNDSGGERIQRLVPDAHVVKAFNIVGNGLMFRPSFPDGPPDMFIAGNDAAAKKTVTAILDRFGWPTIDIGGIEGARYLEAMCLLWVLAGQATKSRTQAFKLLRR
jgi:predicted dinucleotide-binding enzyme